jgi:hypothetical protein
MTPVTSDVRNVMIISWNKKLYLTSAVQQLFYNIFIVNVWKHEIQNNSNFNQQKQSN